MKLVDGQRYAAKGLKPEDYFYGSEDHISDLANGVKSSYGSATEEEEDRLAG